MQTFSRNIVLIRDLSEDPLRGKPLGAALGRRGFLSRRGAARARCVSARAWRVSASVWATSPRSPADQTMADPMRVVRRGAVHQDATTAATASASARRLVIVRLIVLLLLSIRALLGSCSGRLLLPLLLALRLLLLLLLPPQLVLGLVSRKHEGEKSAGKERGERAPPRLVQKVNRASERMVCTNCAGSLLSFLLRPLLLSLLLRL